MALVPSECTNCGYQYQSGLVEVADGAYSTTVSGSGLPCPKCGGPTRLLTGTFDVVDGAIEMISGPEWSWNLVEGLRLGLRRIVENPPEDPVAAVESIDPRIGGMIRQATTGWTRTQVLTLLGVIFAYLTWQGVTPDDIGRWVKEVEGQIVDLLHEVERTGPPEPPPPAT